MNSKTASKARIYLYDEENIIKKITYIYDDGSESKPLTVFKESFPTTVIPSSSSLTHDQKTHLSEPREATAK